jgi:hypothetical protein
LWLTPPTCLSLLVKPPSIQVTYNCWCFSAFVPDFKYCYKNDFLFFFSSLCCLLYLIVCLSKCNHGVEIIASLWFAHLWSIYVRSEIPARFRIYWASWHKFETQTILKE